MELAQKKEEYFAKQKNSMSSYFNALAGGQQEPPPPWTKARLLVSLTVDRPPSFRLSLLGADLDDHGLCEQVAAGQPRRRRAVRSADHALRECKPSS